MTVVARAKIVNVRGDKYEVEVQILRKTCCKWIIEKRKRVIV